MRKYKWLRWLAAAFLLTMTFSREAGAVDFFGNVAPVAVSQTPSILEDIATAITLVATDGNSDPLTYTVVTFPTHGTLSGTAPNLTYHPATDYNGPDSFTFKANDGTVDSNTATVSITVTPVNDFPTLGAIGIVTVLKNAAPQTVNFSGISAGPANESGQELTVIASSSNPGLIPDPTVTYTSPNATGSLSFTPVADAQGTTMIAVMVSDGQVANNQATQFFMVRVVPKTDILWQESNSGLLYLWEMKSATQLGGRFLAPNQIAPNWKMVGIADFDADGKQDILWQESTAGWLYIWYMGGPNGTTQIGGNYLTPNKIETTWKMVGIADFDGDTKNDILWQESTTGWLYIWYLGGPKGATLLSGSYLTPNQIPPTWKMVGVADFNDDDKPDILWQESTAGWLYIWYMGGPKGATQLSGRYLTPSKISTNWKIGAVRDVDGDGKPDLLWQDSAGYLFLWYMGGPYGEQLLRGEWLTPNQIPPTWKIVGSGLIQ